MAMVEDIAQLILRCTKCNKPFDKASTLKRHGYYCRTRTPGDNASRIRSCLSCINSRTRCDRKRPECSRCYTKGIRCQYAAQSPGDNRKRSTPREDRSALHEGSDTILSSQVPVPRATGNGDDGVEDDLSAALAVPPGRFGEQGLERDSYQEDGEWDPLALVAGDNEPLEILSPIDLPFTVPDTTTSLLWPGPVHFADGLTIPRSLSNDQRLLIRRPKATLGAKGAASLICHTLKSYPLMMKRDQTLPPFIHPQMLSSAPHTRHLESLHNCMNLMQMFDAKLPGNRKLFWRNVRLECERMRKSRSKMDRLEILLTLQVLSMYIIMRLDDSETYDNTDDVLIMTVVTICMNENWTDLEQESPSLSSIGPESAWRHWIFAESVRRLCVLNQIVNMVIIFEPARMRHPEKSGLILPQLPTRKQLWDAKSAAQWSREVMRDADAHSHYGMMSNGDLIKFSKSSAGLTEGSGVLSGAKVEWEEWLARADSFGGLVTLASLLYAN